MQTSPSDIAAALESGGFLRSVAGPDFDRVVAAGSALAAGSASALLLTGRAGCGKTLAASIIARVAFRRSELPHMDARTIRCAAVTAFSADGEIAPGVPVDCFRLARCGDILLDDLGAETPVNVYGTPTDLVSEYLVNYCDEKKASRCIITTNLNGSGILARYGDRIFSRLAERFAWLDFTGGDKRVAKIRKF